MRVTFFHNRYRERGGEDSAVESLIDLVAKAGHEVRLYCVDNREAIRGPLGALQAAGSARWNPRVPARVNAFLDEHPCDVAHVHNFFPLLSPALHATLAKRGVAVVQTLHNYRLLCGNALLLRDGAACEECVSRGPWNAVRHGCYRGSRLQTAVWADMVSHHRRRGTWRDAVDVFTTPSPFAKRKLLAAGLPEERTLLLPNPVADPGAPALPGEGAVYVGRLSPEKGVDLLIEAWREQRGAPLTLVGGGPDEAALRARAAGVPGVRFLGAVPRDRALAAIREAAFVVVPSRAYEVFPMVALEAFASGRAVVAPSPGALAEVVEPGATGLHFASGDAAGLADACRTLLADPGRVREMGDEARAVYEEQYAPDRTLLRVEKVYRTALRRRAAA
ncbi:MAG: glycosyltransferase family 4 protein [Myxococcota bacterium]